MGEDLLVLLQPGVDAVEVEDDVGGEDGVGGTEGGDVAVRRAQHERLAGRGVGCELADGADAAAGEHRGVRGLALGGDLAGRDLAPHVGIGDGVERHDPLRLPGEQRRGGVGDHLASEDRPDALARRRVAQLADPLEERFREVYGHGASVPPLSSGRAPLVSLRWR
jgi:hypothetical protein